MKYQIWTKYLSIVAIVALVLPGGCSMPMSAEVPPSTLMTQSHGYSKNMLLGYEATKQINYSTALNHFRQALQAKPRDTYATLAIRNIQSYIERDRYLGRKAKRNLLYIPANFDFGQPGRLIPAGTRTQLPSSDGTVIGLGNNVEQQSGAADQANAPNASTQSQAQINQRSNVYGFGTPARRVSAGSRGGASCTSGNQSLIALAPLEELQITTVGNPTLFFYVPQTTAQQLELVLQDQNRQVVNKATFKAPGKAGIISLSLPGNSPASELKVNKTYRWYFSLVCDRSRRSRDLVVSGSIVRLKPDEKLLHDLASSDRRERANIYALSGSLTDALTNLAQLRRERPNDPDIKTDWQDLLRSVDLGRITEAPLIECCKIP